MKPIYPNAYYLLRFMALILIVSMGLPIWSCTSAAIAQSSLYKLPYPSGLEYEVTQGNNTGPSHDEPTSAYAFDFGMEEGSQVVASRSGTVLYIEESYGRGKCDDAYRNRANYVVIDHGDCTCALYLHLLAFSVIVEPPQRVDQGEPIAQSGASGKVCSLSEGIGAHLHFQVQDLPSGPQYVVAQSIQVSFSDQDVVDREPDGIPKQGQRYISDNAYSPLSAESPIEDSTPMEKIEVNLREFLDSVGESAETWIREHVTKFLRDIETGFSSWLEQQCLAPLSLAILPLIAILWMRIGIDRTRK